MCLATAAAAAGCGGGGGGFASVDADFELLALELCGVRDPRQLVGGAQNRARHRRVCLCPSQKQQLALVVESGCFAHVHRPVAQRDSLDVYNIRVLSGVEL